MPTSIDYYHFLISPWSYLAIAQFNKLKETHSIEVNYKPIDVMQTFENMGGLPPAKRHPSRQRFRMDELKRWSAYLNVPMNFEPAFFPANQALAAQMVYAAGGATGSEEAAKLSDAVLTACWSQERNVADEDTLIAIADEQGLAGKQLLEAAKEPTMIELYQSNTTQAHEQDVFGSPTYVVNNELFWGQDRIMFLERYLESI